jgi:small subunit ribosomal protein S2
MKIPNVTIQQLLEAGVHLGHKTLRWNPKMKKYIFGKRDSIHIIDLTQTLELTKVALEKIHEVISNNGKILFVSTKKQASEAIAEVAKETDQYFVNYRWLGGMLRVTYQSIMIANMEKRHPIIYILYLKIFYGLPME